MAYSKIMLHCMKYPINDCYGFLMGKKKGNVIEVTDALPLTHDKIYSTNLNCSLKLTENYYSKDLKIVGFYENLMLNQMKEDLDISIHSKKVLELINQNSVKGPVLFEIASKDNKDNPNSNVDDIVFLQYLLNEKNGLTDLGEHKETKEEFEKLKKLVSNNMQNDLIDFDDHFEDANLDWHVYDLHKARITARKANIPFEELIA